ncbi:MAG: hypothetical protein R3Y68_06130 [Rikenellaceae bacterium]
MGNTNDINEEIKLPFEDDKFDLALWIYYHQEGIVISVIIYMLMAIFFVFAHITIEQVRLVETITIQIAEIEIERERPIEKIDEAVQQEKEKEEVQNAVSNEESSVGSIDMSETMDLLRESEAQIARMEAQRLEYERGLAEIEAMRAAAAERLAAQAAEEAAAKEAEEAARKDSSVKVVGNVAVSYSVINPIRHAKHLIVPSYTCEGGGEVVVAITLDISGAVTSAKVIRGGDQCMQAAAIRSARHSLFNPDSRASDPQPGKITYMFVAQ